ncbi:MAG: spinster family MFS transporter [Gemmatimonadales bacterium]
MSRPADRSWYSWYVVAVLMIAYVSSFIDRQIIALMVTPIRRDLGISDTQMSLLMGLSFAVFYSVLGLPIGRLADRMSRRTIIAWAIATWSVMTAFCGLARNYWQLFLARVGVGVGEAGLSPPAYSMIADYFPKDRLGAAIGIYSLGIYLGSGLALMLGGWITGRVSGDAAVVLPVLGSLRAWQVVFLAIGIPGLLMSLWVATLKEPRRGGMASGPVDPVPVAGVVAYVRRHLGAFAGHNFGFAAIALVNYSWAYWVPTWLQRIHGWTPRQVGLTYGLWTATFGVAGVVIGGLLGDWLARRGYADAKIRIGLIGITGELASAFLFLFAPTSIVSWALIPSTFFASFGFGAAAAAIQEISPVPMRAQTSAVYLLVVNLIGQTFGPLLVAALTDYVFGDDMLIGRSILVVTVAGLVVAAVTFFLTLAPFRRAAAGVEAWRAEHAR